MAKIWTDVSEWAQHYLGLSPTMSHHILWTALVWIGVQVIRTLASRIIERRVTELGRRYTVSKTISYLLGCFGIVATLMIWFGNFTGWAAYLGILSAGLAVALQIPLTNLAGWVFISARKPFVVGDRIEIGSFRGDVIDMRLFQFSLVEIGNWVDADQSTGRIVHIPNGMVFRESTANYTAGFNFIWNELPVTVTFESDWEKAKQILSDLAEKHTAVNTNVARDQLQQATRKYMVHFQYLTPIVWTAVADHGVTLTIRYICEPRRRRSTAGNFWEDILRAFALADDIDFAYPTTRFYNNVGEGKPEARANPSPRSNAD